MHSGLYTTWCLHMFVHRAWGITISVRTALEAVSIAKRNGSITCCTHAVWQNGRRSIAERNVRIGAVTP